MGFEHVQVAVYLIHPEVKQAMLQAFTPFLRVSLVDMFQKKAQVACGFLLF